MYVVRAHVKVLKVSHDRSITNTACTRRVDDPGLCIVIKIGPDFFIFQICDYVLFNCVWVIHRYACGWSGFLGIMAYEDAMAIYYDDHGTAVEFRCCEFKA